MDNWMSKSARESIPRRLKSGIPRKEMVNNRKQKAMTDLLNLLYILLSKWMPLQWELLQCTTKQTRTELRSLNETCRKAWDNSRLPHTGRRSPCLAACLRLRIPPDVLHQASQSANPKQKQGAKIRELVKYRCESRAQNPHNANQVLQIADRQK